MDGAFRAKISPQFRTRLKDGASAPPAFGTRLNWAILRFLVKRIGWGNCAAFSNAGLFAIRNGARGKEGARVEN